MRFNTTGLPQPPSFLFGRTPSSNQFSFLFLFSSLSLGVRCCFLGGLSPKALPNTLGRILGSILISHMMMVRLQALNYIDMVI